MSDTRVEAEFTVRFWVDPDVYREEYGSFESAALVTAMDRMREYIEEPDAEEDDPYTWYKASVGDVVIVPPHRDALLPGQRNPYDPESGEFIAKCVCGGEFRDDMSPDGAEFLLSEHCEAENAAHPNVLFVRAAEFMLRRRA